MASSNAASSAAAQLEVVRSLGISAGQGYLLARPAEQPPTAAINIEELVAGSNWLMDSLRAVPA